MASSKRVLLVGGVMLLASGCSRCGQSHRDAVPVPSLSPAPAVSAPNPNPDSGVTPGSQPDILPNRPPEEFGSSNPSGLAAPIESGAAPGQPPAIPQNVSPNGTRPAGPQHSFKSQQELQEMGGKPMIPKDPYGASAEARETLKQMMERGRTPQPIPTGPLPLPHDMKKIQESGSQPMIPPALAAPTSAPMPYQRLER